MRKIILFALVAMFLPLAAAAQEKVNVIGTVMDPHGTLYAGGTISARLVPPGGPSPTVNGLPINGFSGNYPMGDAVSAPGGVFSMSIYGNDVITPANTQWVFTVCNPGSLPPVGFSNICFDSGPLTITGGDVMDISAQLNALAPVLLNIFGGGGGVGTVKSVGLSGPGGIFSVTGSPVTSIGTLGLHVTGVSGGIPCFTATNVISASVLQTTNMLMKGGGAGACPTPSTIFDDGTNPPRSPNGLNVASAGISAELQNSGAGTSAQHLVCLDGSRLAVTCPDNVTAAVQGTALSGAGTAGTVVVCKLIACQQVFDNQSVPGDFAIPAVGGALHDTGSQLPTQNNENFVVLTANTGTGTSAFVSPPGDVVGGSSAAGCVNPMVQHGDFITGGAGGGCARLAGASTLTNVPQVITSTFDGTQANSTATPAGIGPRVVGGTTASDTLIIVDRAFRVDYQGSVAVATNIGTPTSLGGAGIPIKTVNDTTGVGTAVTFTGTGGATMKNGSGAAAGTLVMPQGTACTFYVDGSVSTQWDVDCQPVSANSNVRTCMIPLGTNNGSPLGNTDLGPQSFQCWMDSNGTVVEVDIQAINATGTPSIIAGRNHQGTITNLVSGALATAATGGHSCSNAGGTVGIDGVTTCSATLQNTAFTKGDYLQMVSGTADGAATLLSVAITFLRK